MFLPGGRAGRVIDENMNAAREGVGCLPVVT
jgi:hypothetical protein